MKKQFMILSAASLAIAPLPVAHLSTPAKAMMMSGRCAAIVETLGADAIGSPPPESAGTIAQLTNVMWMTKLVLDYTETHCDPSDDDYISVRSSYQATYDSAEAACKALATSASLCVPTRYRG